MEEQTDNVVVSENEMAKIDNEITNVEQDKLNAAKEAGVKEGIAKATTENTIQQLQAQLKQSVDKIAEMEQKVDGLSKPPEVEVKVEEPVVEVKEEVQEVKEEERPQRRGVVIESNSPLQEPVQTQPEVIESASEQWAQFENSVRTQGFRASIKKEDI